MLEAKMFLGINLFSLTCLLVFTTLSSNRAILHNNKKGPQCLDLGSPLLFLFLYVDEYSKFATNFILSLKPEAGVLYFYVWAPSIFLLDCVKFD